LFRLFLLKKTGAGQRREAANGHSNNPDRPLFSLFLQRKYSESGQAHASRPPGRHDDT
jgi:hypothetical protein